MVVLVAKMRSLVAVLFILINRTVATTQSLMSPDTNTSSLCSKRDPLMDPFYETRYGQDVVWQIPPNPKAVLFLAHGMDKEPLSFFDSAPNCVQCYGLPEERAAILAALASNYAVIMVKSLGRYWLPWNVEWPVPPSPDRTIVVSVIREWTREHSLEHLPLAAWGYSSGGNFTTLLTMDLDIKSMILMCTPGEVELIKHANSVPFPPTLFIAMPADNAPYGFYVMVLAARRMLESEGVLTEQIDVLPKPIHPSTFAEKIPCLDQATSENIYAAYKSEEWIDENSYVTKNPLIFDWEAVLWKHKVLDFCEETNDLCFAKHVQQELSVSYAFHSFTSSTDELVFNWLDDTLFLGSSDPVGSSASR